MKKSPSKAKVSSRKPSSMGDWAPQVDRELRKILKKCRGLPTLKRKGPAGSVWQVEVRLMGAEAMRKLNLRFRGKDYPTDVLSFPPPDVFREIGMLGELVICVPVMKRQASELHHSAEEELRVLLVHGLLHLLGFDHEEGPRQAAVMKKWEAVLLGSRAAKRGLIQRTG